MRAIQQVEFGGPEVLQLVDVPVPTPGPGEVLVKVTKAGLNFADVHQRSNDYVAGQDLPRTPGSEVAGVREDTGERVVGICGTGGYAEHALVPANRLWPIPDGCSDEDALALLLQGLTAWHLHKTQGRVQPGETVVVISGAGGVGSLAVQLAKPLAGAGRVIATASSPEKRQLCLDLGADVAIDGDPEGLEDRLLEANGGRKVDVVFEMAGGDVFDACVKATGPLGRVVVYGISSREQRKVSTGRLLKGSLSVVGFWLFHFLDVPQTREALDDLFGRAARGEVRTVIGGTYPLADARRAQADLAARRTTGKLVLDVTA